MSYDSTSCLRSVLAELEDFIDFKSCLGRTLFKQSAP
jgi:hypothetical protein